MAPMRPLELTSVGYERRSLQQVVDALLQRGVKRLVDVRLHPWSQRPEWRQEWMAPRFREAGIVYVHSRNAGNPVRGATMAECADRYAKHLDELPERVTRSLADVILQPYTAVLCTEAHHTECHRGLLVPHLASLYGVDVELVEALDEPRRPDTYQMNLPGF